MPTNLLRGRNKPRPGTGPAEGPRGSDRPQGEPGAAREIFIHAGKIVVRARLLATPTADRIWTTLPIYSTAETWGRAVHFETHAESGRETGARALVKPGEIAFQAEDDRVYIAFGKTPISRPGEVRLPSPCNVWAIALDDVSALAAVQPGQKIAILEAAS